MLNRFFPKLYNQISNGVSDLKLLTSDTIIPKNKEEPPSACTPASQSSCLPCPRAPPDVRKLIHLLLMREKTSSGPWPLSDCDKIPKVPLPCLRWDRQNFNQFLLQNSLQDQTGIRPHSSVAPSLPIILSHLFSLSPESIRYANHRVTDTCLELAFLRNLI